MSQLNRVLDWVRDLRRAARFKRPFVTNLYRGVYPTYAEAARSIPRNVLKGFEHDIVVKQFEGDEGRWKLHDYPAAFWLREAIKTHPSVFDLGGGWGQTFYAYRPYLGQAPDLHWTVCDLEALTTRGRQVAAERNEPALGFTTRPGDMSGCGTLLTGGALQYLERDLSDILASLDQKPQHLIAHHIPFYDGPEYYTVQRMNYSYVAYKIMNRKQFVERICAQGYELCDSWDKPRMVNVMFHPERLVSDYSGFYFTRK